MRSITPAAALEQISGGTLDSLYLILGDDAVEMAETAAAFEQAVEEGIRAFNVDRLHGGSATLGQVIEATRTLPMMAPRRVVIVLHAEHCLTPKRETQATAADQKAFETYLAESQSHVTLVLVAGGLDKRRKIVKRLLDAAVVVMCGVVETVAEAERWVQRRLAADGVAIEPVAARLLAAAAGPDLARLRGDVERLLLFAAGQASIGAEEARAIAGPAAAYDDWAVARAIERGHAAEALKELALVMESGAAPYMVLGQLAWVVRTKIPPARVPAAVDALFRTDLDLKNSLGDQRVLLERLVLELCGAGKGDTGRRPRDRPRTRRSPW